MEKITLCSMRNSKLDKAGYGYGDGSGSGDGDGYG